MRPSLLLLAIAASCVSATQLGCPRHLFEELVARTSCGDNKAISKCLTSDIDLARLDEIEQCYTAGGCSKADATVGAVWFAHEYRTEVEEEDERQELRRRADSSSSDSAKETATDKTSEKTTSKAAAKSTTAKTTESSAAASSTSAPSSAAASTTSDSTTSDSTTASTTATTASSTTSSTTETTSSSSTTGTGKVTTTGTLLCSTTNTVQTSYCPVTSGTTGTCVATITLISTCAAGNLCMTNSAGENTCMKIDNTVGVGGIIIAIMFGSAIAAIAVGIIIMNHKANAVQKKKEAQAAAFVYKGKAADLEAPSEANLPLIQEPGQQVYGGQEYVDHGRRAPQLHQGLGALR